MFLKPFSQSAVPASTSAGRDLISIDTTDDRVLVRPRAAGGDGAGAVAAWRRRAGAGGAGAGAGAAGVGAGAGAARRRRGWRRRRRPAGVAGVCATASDAAQRPRGPRCTASPKLDEISLIAPHPLPASGRLASGHTPLYMSPAAKITRPYVTKKVFREALVHPLANRIAAKMNGLGNEIVVLDLRDSRPRFARRTRAPSGPCRASLFDQLMVIERPADPAHDGRLAIYNIDGSRAEACGNGTRCVAAFLGREVDRTRYAFESDAGLLDVRREGDGAITVDMGAPRLDWAAIPLAHEADHARHGRCRARRRRSRARPAISSRVNMGNPACGLLRRGRGRGRSRKSRAGDRASSALSRARKRQFRAASQRGAHPAARLGARGRRDARLRHGRLRDARRRRADRHDRPRRVRDAARAATCGSNGARRRPCPDDRARRNSSSSGCSTRLAA